METEIKWIGDMERVRLGPNDVLVLNMDQYMPHEQLQRLHDALCKVFPRNETVILGPGEKLGVMGADHVD